MCLSCLMELTRAEWHSGCLRNILQQGSARFFFPVKDNTVILSFNDGLCHNYSIMEVENTDRQWEKHRYICVLIKLYFQKEDSRFIGPHVMAAQPLTCLVTGLFKVLHTADLLVSAFISIIRSALLALCTSEPFLPSDALHLQPPPHAPFSFSPPSG